MLKKPKPIPKTKEHKQGTESSMNGYVHVCISYEQAVVSYEEIKAPTGGFGPIIWPWPMPKTLPPHCPSLGDSVTQMASLSSLTKSPSCLTTLVAHLIMSARHFGHKGGLPHQGYVSPSGQPPNPQPNHSMEQGGSA